MIAPLQHGVDQGQRKAVHARPVGDAHPLFKKFLPGLTKQGLIEHDAYKYVFILHKNRTFGKSMNQYLQIEIAEFGARLKQERERLGMSMHDFAELGEVNRVTQMRYETEANYPTVEYMYKVGQHGVDTMFIETGVRASDLVPINDLEAFSQAIDLIDELAKLHNFKPSAEFRGRSILKVYRQILKFGVRKVKPTLEDLLNAVQE